jgi:hypothetical protein
MPWFSMWSPSCRFSHQNPAHATPLPLQMPHAHLSHSSPSISSRYRATSSQWYSQTVSSNSYCDTVKIIFDKTYGGPCSHWDDTYWNPDTWLDWRVGCEPSLEMWPPTNIMHDCLISHTEHAAHNIKMRFTVLLASWLSLHFRAFFLTNKPHWRPCTSVWLAVTQFQWRNCQTSVKFGFGSLYFYLRVWKTFCLNFSPNLGKIWHTKQCTILN